MTPKDMQAEIDRLRAALRPFAHPDLCESLSGNMQGDASPVYGRNNATLTLGDFRRAAEALTPPQQGVEATEGNAGEGGVS